MNPDTLAAVSKIATRTVTAHLPADLQVFGQVDAKKWFARLCAESDVYGIRTGGNLIGFLTLHAASDDRIMIGYLFGQESWGAGFASELVGGLLGHLRAVNWAGTLTGGVEAENPASARVLVKSGFSVDGQGDGDVVFYSCDV